MRKTSQAALLVLLEQDLINKGVFNFFVSSAYSVQHVQFFNVKTRKYFSLLFVIILFSDDIEQQVCPVIMQLSDPESIDDLRTEAVAVSPHIAVHISYNCVQTGGGVLWF